MARIKLTIPDNKIASVNIPVRITDINYGNHLGNDVLVSIVHEARAQWLRSNGYSEIDVEGTGLIMSDLAVEYIHESFYGDELQIDISVGETARVSFELYYTIQTTRNEKIILIARAKTGMVCYNYAIKKVAAVPEKFKCLLVE
jgi:acyl-CoA thioester hydrolase